MFIDFTVENYRSIKEPLTLSAVAQSHGANERDNKIAEPYTFSARKLEVLPVLGIFGANASGKSNVINALGDFLSSIYFNSHPIDDYRVKYTFSAPFKLDETSSQLPSRFELRVFAGDNLYIYNLDVNEQRILREKMSYIPESSRRNVSRLLYQRTWVEDLKEYSVKNGSDFGEKYRELQVSVKDTQTFLGLVAGSLNSDVLYPFITWLTYYLAYSKIKGSAEDDQTRSTLLLANRSGDTQTLSKVITMLKKFDTGIEDIEILGPKVLENGELEFENPG